MNKNYIIILLLITVSCSSPLVDVTSTGDMNLTLDQSAMKSIISDLDTVPASYRIEGFNATGSTFDVVTADTNIQFPDLSPGLWQISVCAYNSIDQVIAEGTGSLDVLPGGYAAMTVVLYETTGSGSLDFSVIWNADLVYSETLEITLTNLNGDVIPMTYNHISGIAAGLTENLSAGFYTLEVQLFDDFSLVMGAMELIQIREGGQTDINLDFAQLNKAGQRIPVSTENFTISWDQSDLPADFYKVYYRNHGTFTWTYLGSTASGTILEFTIDQSILTYGVYDLAVSSVVGIEESELHSSMDDSALPATGWYIDWMGI